MQLHRLRVLRAEKNITQLELARQLGWSSGRVWHIEHGYREATAEERAALARFFNVTEHAIWAVPDKEAA
jgi:transcriptional regulator with XRE-family HTH domain